MMMLMQMWMRMLEGGYHGLADSDVEGDTIVFVAMVLLLSCAIFIVIASQSMFSNFVSS